MATALVALTVLIVHDASPASAQIASSDLPDITLDVDVFYLNERDDHTIITVTATMARAATQDTPVALSLRSSPLLTQGVGGASSSDYYSDMPNNHRSVTIKRGQTSASTTIAIDPTYDTSVEGDEAIVVTGEVNHEGVQHLTVAPTDVIIEDGPYLSFPKYIYGQLHYPGERIDVTVEKAINQADRDGTVTYSLTKTEPADNPLGLTFDPATRQLTGIAPADVNVTADGITTRYTVTARDSLGHRATTMISMAVVKEVCLSSNTTLFPTGTHPMGQSAPPAELVRDCNVLLAAKAPLSGDGTLNWATDTAITSWNGLTFYTANTKNISQIAVRNMSLNGKIPPVLGHLATPDDARLVLGDHWQTAPAASKNTLTGPIPPELGIPPKLIELALGNSNLTGPIPRELTSSNRPTGNRLLYLYLHNNDLSGPIPPEFGNLVLRALNIFGNPKVTGHIPWQLGKNVPSPVPRNTGHSQFGFQVLRLDQNGLTGNIPWQLGRFGKIQTLALTGNKLTGSIPWQLGNLGKEEANVQRRIVYLYLNNNQLTGPIPPQLGNTANLVVLSLGENRLTGPIPAELGRLSKLQYLYLHINQLSGEIPSELGRLSALRQLHLYDNQLTGSIPTELGSLSSLTFLHLYKNQLTGSIPTELGGLSSMQYLILSCNDFSGSVPGSIGGITALRNLWIHGNPKLDRSYGGMPDSIKQHANLIVLRGGPCLGRNGNDPASILDWSAGLTPQDLGDGKLGCDDDHADRAKGCRLAIDDTNFVLDGTTYTITKAFFQADPTDDQRGVFKFTLSPAAPEAIRRYALYAGPIEHRFTGTGFNTGDNSDTTSWEGSPALFRNGVERPLEFRRTGLTPQGGTPPDDGGGQPPPRDDPRPRTPPAQPSPSPTPTPTPSPEPETRSSDLLARYDADDSGTIETSELVEAINDYLFGEGDDAISQAELVVVINLYLFG